MQETGYRESHQGKGREYHAQFTQNPRRALIWSIEQRFLGDIARRFLSPGEADHLDFACGSGRILARFADNVRSSTGVDVSTSMLESAKTLVPQARLIEADITRQEVFDGQLFDLITAFRFFPNAEPTLRHEVIKALYPLLRPGGLLVFNNHRNVSCLAFRVGRLLKRTNTPFFGMSAREVAELVGSVGLSVERIYHVGIVPEFETRMLRPRFLVGWIESLATRLPVAGLSEDLIYVCRKSASPSGEDAQSQPSIAHTA